MPGRSFRHLALLASASPLAATEPEIIYEKDIFPILEKRCFKCHNKDKMKAGVSVEFDEDHAVLRLKNDRIYKYPIGNLSVRSRLKVKAFAKER